MDEFELIWKTCGDIWLSCTAPLKHSPQARLAVSGPEGVNAINQLKRTDGVWSGTSTDDVGFIAACQHIGIDRKEAYCECAVVALLLVQSAVGC